MVISTNKLNPVEVIDAMDSYPQLEFAPPTEAGLPEIPNATAALPDYDDAKC